MLQPPLPQALHPRLHAALQKQMLSGALHPQADATPLHCEQPVHCVHAEHPQVITAEHAEHPEHPEHAEHPPEHWLQLSHVTPFGTVHPGIHRAPVSGSTLIISSRTLKAIGDPPFSTHAFTGGPMGRTTRSG